MAILANVQESLNGCRGNECHQGPTECTRRFRKSRTISGNVPVRNASSNARAGIKRMLGGHECQNRSSGAGPSPYTSKAHRVSDAPRYELSCLKISPAFVLVRI